MTSDWDEFQAAVRRVVRDVAEALRAVAERAAAVLARLLRRGK